MKPALADGRTKQTPVSPQKVAPLHRVDDDAHLGQFIPLHYHGQMLANEQRMAPFHEAIDKLVPIGGHVVELGGGTGVMSFLASKRARRRSVDDPAPTFRASVPRSLRVCPKRTP